MFGCDLVPGLPRRSGQVFWAAAVSAVVLIALALISGNSCSLKISLSQNRSVALTNGSPRNACPAAMGCCILSRLSPGRRLPASAFPWKRGRISLTRLAHPAAACCHSTKSPAHCNQPVHPGRAESELNFANLCMPKKDNLTLFSLDSKF